MCQGAFHATYMYVYAYALTLGGSVWQHPAGLKYKQHALK